MMVKCMNASILGFEFVIMMYFILIFLDEYFKESRPNHRSHGANDYGETLDYEVEDLEGKRSKLLVIELS